MQTPRTHIAPTVRSIVLAVLVCGVVMPGMLRADGSRKTSTKAERATTEKRAMSLLKYGAPVYGAMQTLNALQSKDMAKAKAGGKTATRDADTSRMTSKFLGVRASGDVVTVRIELLRDEPQLEIGLYNMLGKKVQDVQKGATSRGVHEYTAPVSDLPEGVYICIMQGADFRRAEKFYLSR
ncbi:MAG: T9SS type A sorting domain-containing protein [Candidatus Kapabacteria bacterium]|nr:T9SS type A sorting domain-containing protein [Candidatus Kapabacteria bacterium]